MNIDHTILTVITFVPLAGAVLLALLVGACIAALLALVPAAGSAFASSAGSVGTYMTP